MQQRCLQPDHRVTDAVRPVDIAGRRIVRPLMAERLPACAHLQTIGHADADQRVADQDRIGHAIALPIACPVDQARFDGHAPAIDDARLRFEARPLRAELAVLRRGRRRGGEREQRRRAAPHDSRTQVGA
ncbi:hypothetical protein WR25_15590 [Diploscapter pachys]|uniref:Uncharacterized protein n=1 Tax=Diploscapter pachys TaxID=2018661 RepID=A0A2A2K8X4_9BILA|nr:hypothetical protein WR25_15590 [Diploscapter pachys]